MEEEVRDHEKMEDIIFDAEKYGKVTLFDMGYDTNKSHWKLKKKGIKPSLNKDYETKMVDEEKKELKRLSRLSKTKV